MSHPSLLSLCDVSLSLDFPVGTVLAELTCPESAGHAHLRTSSEKLGYLAKSALNTGYEPKKFDKSTSVDNDTMLIDDSDLNEISDFSKNARENSGLFGVLTMFESSVSHVSHRTFLIGNFALQRGSQESMHREDDCWTERERERKREGSGGARSAGLSSLQARTTLVFCAFLWCVVSSLMELCRYDMGCWRPLCPYGHSGRRAARWSALWALLAEQEAQIVDEPVPQIMETLLIPQMQAQNRMAEHIVDVPVLRAEIGEVIQLTAEQIDDLPAPQKQYEEFSIKSSCCRADKVLESTALNGDTKATLETSITDTKSVIQPTQLYATAEKNSQEQHKEFMSESPESRLIATTALNDSKDTPVSNLPEHVQSIESAPGAEKYMEVLDVRLHDVEALISILMEDKESDLLDSVIQRFQSVESLIANLAHSLHQQKAEHAEIRKSLDTPRAELVLPAQMPPWLESVPDRLASLEASVVWLESVHDRLASLEASVVVVSSSGNFTDTKSVLHPTLPFAAEEENSQKQYEKLDTESAESRADKLTTALNDYTGTPGSSFTGTWSELRSAQFSAAEVENPQKQCEKSTTESPKSRVDMLMKTTALNDDLNGLPESSISDTKSEFQFAQSSTVVLQSQEHIVEERMKQLTGKATDAAVEFEASEAFSSDSPTTAACRRIAAAAAMYRATHDMDVPVPRFPGETAEARRTPYGRARRRRAVARRGNDAAWW